MEEQGFRDHTVPHSKGISGKMPLTWRDEDTGSGCKCAAKRGDEMLLMQVYTASQAGAGGAGFIAVFLTRPSLAILRSVQGQIPGG